MAGLFTLWVAVALWGANFMSSRNVQSDEKFDRGIKTACEYVKGGNSTGLSLDLVGTVSTGESANTGEATTWCMGEMTSIGYDNVVRTALRTALDVGGANLTGLLHDMVVGTGDAVNTGAKSTGVFHDTVGTGDAANTVGES